MKINFINISHKDETSNAILQGMKIPRNTGNYCTVAKISLPFLKYKSSRNAIYRGVSINFTGESLFPYQESSIWCEGLHVSAVDITRILHYRQISDQLLSHSVLRAISFHDGFIDLITRSLKRGRRLLKSFVNFNRPSPCLRTL